MAWNFQAGGADNNSHISGLGGISGGNSKQGIYDVSTTQNYPLGHKMEFEDGRCFRYAYFSTACGPGKMAAQDVSLTNVASIDGKFVDSAGAAKDTYAVGDKTIYVRDSTVFASDTDVVNNYAGGYFGITDDQGEGHTYRIKTSSVGDLSETQGLIKFELYDGLAVALDSQTSCGIVGHPFKNMTIAVANSDSPVRGLTMVDVAAAEYAWILTRGTGYALVDESAGTVAINSIAVVSDGVNGALTVMGQGTAASEENLAQLTTEGIVGEWLSAAADTEYAPVWLRLE